MRPPVLPLVVPHRFPTHHVLENPRGASKTQEGGRRAAAPVLWPWHRLPRVARARPPIRALVPKKRCKTRRTTIPGPA